MVFEGKGRAWRPTRWNDLFGLWRERALSGNQGLLAFNPLLALGHEFGFVAAAVGNGFADDDADRAGNIGRQTARPRAQHDDRIDLCGGGGRDGLLGMGGLNDHGRTDGRRSGGEEEESAHQWPRFVIGGGVTANDY